jgi:hypothetical protein
MSDLCVVLAGEVSQRLGRGDGWGAGAQQMS